MHSEWPKLYILGQSKCIRVLANLIALEFKKIIIDKKNMDGIENGTKCEIIWPQLIQ